MAFKSPALLSLGDAQSPPQAAQAAAAAAAAARADSERWAEGEQKPPSALADSASPPPGGGGWEASPSPPPPHRAQKDELARGEKGRGLRLSWVGNQWARARWPATSSGAEPAERGAGRVAPRALSVHSPCCGAGAGRNAEGSGVGRGQATSSPSSEGRGKCAGNWPGGPRVGVEGMRARKKNNNTSLLEGGSPKPTPSTPTDY